MPMQIFQNNTDLDNGLGNNAPQVYRSHFLLVNNVSIGPILKDFVTSHMRVNSPLRATSQKL